MLKLTNNQIGAQGAGHLARLLSKVTTLQQLDVSNNRIQSTAEDRGFCDLLKSLMPSASELTSLKLGSTAEEEDENQFFDEGSAEEVQALVAILKAKPPLTKLSISNIGINQSG